MKLGIIHGYYLSPFTAEQYAPLSKYGIKPIGVASEDCRYDLSGVKFPIMRVKRFGQYNRIPLLSLALQYFFPYNDYIFNFSKIIKQFDLLHSIDQHYPFSYQCAISNKPSIFTVWENIPFNNERFAYKKFKRTVYKNAEHFVAITKKAKQALETEGVDSDRISVIPPAIDTNRFKLASKDRELLRLYNLPENSKTILFIGRLCEEKGILDLLFSFSKIIKRDDNVYLLIAGKGRLKPKILTLIKRLGIKNNVRFIGQISYYEVHNLHNLADVFCLPSKSTRIWQEQFGYVLVEAMSCGKPVISTCSGSIEEVVKNNKTGILVQESDLDGLTQALDKILFNTSFRKKLGYQARKHVLNSYHPDIISKRLAKLYKQYS